MGNSYSKRQITTAGRILRNLESSTPDELMMALQTIDDWRASHAQPLRKVNANLRYYARKVGVEAPEVTQRLKRFATIADKLRREPNMALSRMEDIGGVRVILPHQQQVDTIVLDLLAQPRWKIRRVREYIAGRKPGLKADGYRAVHVIVEKDGCYIEIQLRTPWQDAWAQSVEQDTRRLAAGLKFGAGPVDLRNYYVMISELLAMREADEDPTQEFMEELANRFAATRGYFPNEER
ncbi:MAG TPA: RelA/SpoT domain-containing protein [Solirubrobacteraceae bacterium]|nr:RelA/SpoT domain-containing protein [Solirubrobacteraceae bacterium]